MAEQQGAETRAQILPSTEPKGIGFFGPAYDYADNLVQPQFVGVRKEGSMSAVLDGIKGVAYYIDTIAFGQSSGGLTRSLSDKLLPYGVNYFVKNGVKCSNGADAYTYMELIPRGDALGENVKSAISGIGLAQLRGLAPGVIEDAKAATDVRPLMKAVTGGAYARCEKVTKPVGDALGNIADLRVKPPVFWVDEPSTVEYVRGRPLQTKWVIQDYISKSEFDAEPKTLNPDGTSIQTSPEPFVGSQGLSTSHLVFIAALLGLANMWAYRSR
jgi:hypothetical protein